MDQNFQSAKNVLFTSIFPNHSYNFVSNIMVELTKAEKPTVELLDSTVTLLLNSINLKHTFLDVNNLILELNKQKQDLIQQKEHTEDGTDLE